MPGGTSAIPRGQVRDPRAKRSDVGNARAALSDIALAYEAMDRGAILQGHCAKAQWRRDSPQQPSDGSGWQLPHLPLHQPIKARRARARAPPPLSPPALPPSLPPSLTPPALFFPICLLSPCRAAFALSRVCVLSLTLSFLSWCSCCSGTPP